MIDTSLIMNKYINCVLFSKYHPNTHDDLFYIDVSKDNYFNEQELYCRPIYINVEPSTLIELSPIMINIIKECVKNNTYLVCKSCFASETSKTYECIVVGYNDNCSRFHIKAFNADESIVDKEIDCEEFVISFVPNLQRQIVLQFWICNSDDTSYDIKCDGFKNELKDYLFSTNSKGIDSEGLIFGINAEHALIGYLSMKIDIGDKIEIKYIAEFAEHKDLMQKRIRFLHQNGIVTELEYNQIKSISDEAIACINVGKEYNYKCEKVIGRKLIYLMKIVLEKQEAFLRKLLVDLD